MERHYDTIIIGGGVIGTSIAYQLAKRGQRVVILERGRVAGEASSAAAGILGAQLEIDEPGPMFDLVCASRAMFPALSGELKELTGIDIGFVPSGALKVALEEEEAERFQEIARWQREQGEEVAWLTPETAVQKEPLLSGQFAGALYAPAEGQVSAPDLSLAYLKAAVAEGAEILEYTEVVALEVDGQEARGVLTCMGPLHSAHVVVATGAWSGMWLEGLPHCGMVGDAAGIVPEVKTTGTRPGRKSQHGSSELADVGVEETGIGDLPVYPVKGECFSVMTHQPLLKHTIFSEGCYLVPKKGGRLIVGATVLPHTFDRKVTFQGLYSLMEKARALLPAIEQAEVERSWTGLRPMSADGFPIMGEDERLKGLYYATGHYRNGILLSPVTGILIADWITGRKPEVQVDASFFHPSRFSKKANC